MFGAFKSSNTLLGGLLWKIPWKLSAPQKRRQRQRLRDVDNVIKQLTLGLHVMRSQTKGSTFEEAIHAKKMFKPRSEAMRLINKPAIFPKENQMSSKDKYTVFSKTDNGYRKGVHKVPKWTKLSLRRNPKFF